MKTAKTTATITLLVAAGLAMAACTPTAPVTPTPTTTSSPAPTGPATPTPGAVATNPQAPKPATQQEAIISASKTISSFLVASFAVDSNPQLGGSYLGAFLAPGSPEQKVIDDTVAFNIAHGWHQKGSPSTWSTNDAMSYATQVTNVGTGEKDPLGGVIVYGCSDNSGWTMEVPAGQTPPPIPRGSFPGQWTLRYDQAKHVWLVVEAKDLSHQQGAPKC